MNAWDRYKDRIEVRGGTKRNVILKREQRYIEKMIADNLSYNTVCINGLEQNVAIIDTDIFTEKFIYAMPGDEVIHGGLVEWFGSYWLITDVDQNNTVYMRGKMTQCNHLLKWVSDDGVIREQWCVVEDGTKYLTGEYEDRNFVVTRGDSRLALTIPKNELTVKFNREQRFLIDDSDSPLKLAYLLTKPFKMTGVYNNVGVYKFVLQEVVTTDDDNQELGIADYYKYFPKPNVEAPSEGNDINNSTQDEREVWI